MAGVDWRALLQVGPDLPNRLNRAFDSVNRDVTSLRTDVDDLEAAIDEIDPELPDVGPGAGAYGGTGGEFVESVTLDAKGRVTALTTEVPSGSTIDITGSVFSMTGPLGGSAPVAAWDFTRFVPGETLAQYLVGANISGSSTYDLVAVGTPTFPTAPTFEAPAAAVLGGGGLLSTAQNSHARIAGTAPASLRLTGAVTVEWIGRPGQQATDIAYMVAVGGDTELQADNFLYLLHYDVSANTIGFLSESGAGVNDARTIAQLGGIGTSGTSGWAHALGQVHICVTRDASQNIIGYINGRRVTQAITGVAPDGGTTAFFQIGRCNGGAGTNSLITYGVRVSDYAFTAAQVLESYYRSFYGRAST